MSTASAQCSPTHAARAAYLPTITTLALSAVVLTAVKCRGAVARLVHLAVPRNVPWGGGGAGSDNGDSVAPRPC